ncbi:hypothetical protein ASC78_01630 [Variovorax sp. Root318D1]|uniref:DUF4286 family protein n=1 Tax=Variovorax sp. Root318D1 TaxID=1736513 RepID=UPI0007154735|nr:DUF4286 family protein [Variovorax sp. Root318D1]KQU91654.1 hypothetical protein ASC78_01630 [Variovorax sp. Root318D1]
MNDDMAGTGAVLALWNDVTPDVDAEYNTWHAGEHVPERLTVPGMLWGRRYRRACNSLAPRYLTLYGMRDVQVLDSDAYRLLLSRPTPMSAHMRPHLRNLSRWVCDVREAHGFLASTHVAVWTFDAEDAARACAGAQAESCPHDLLLAQRSPDAAPLPWLTGSQAQAIEGSWLLAMGMPGQVMASAQAVPGAVLYKTLPVQPALAPRL